MVIQFALLYATAWIRGLFWKWPRKPEVPTGYTACSCSMVAMVECWSMFRLGWEPWCFQKVSACGCSGWSGCFRIPERKDYPMEVEP